MRTSVFFDKGKADVAVSVAGFLGSAYRYNALLVVPIPCWIVQSIAIQDLARLLYKFLWPSKLRRGWEALSVFT